MKWADEDVSTWLNKQRGKIYVKIPGGDGKWKSSGKTSEAEAVKWALRVANGGLSEETTVAEFASGFFFPGRADYLDDHRGRSPDYWRALQAEVDHYIVPKWGHRSFDDITAAEVKIWLSGLTSVRAARNPSVEKRDPNRLLSGRSRQSVLSTMGVIWQWAKLHGLVEVNRIADVPKPELNTKDGGRFIFAELQKMFPLDLSSLWSHPWGLFFLVAAETGCRPQEVAGMSAADFLPDRRAIIVHQAADRHNGIKPLKTNRRGVKRKAVGLSERLTQLLVAHLGSRQSDFLFFRVESGGQHEVHLPLRVDTANDIFQKTLDRIPDFQRNQRTPYCLRHTANTRMRTELGDDLARANMGHVTEAMTKLYDHPDDEDLLKRIGR